MSNYNISIIYRQFENNQTKAETPEGVYGITAPPRGRELLCQHVLTMRFCCDDSVSEALTRDFNSDFKKRFTENLQRSKSGDGKSAVVDIINVATLAAQEVCRQYGGMFVPIRADKIVNIELNIVHENTGNDEITISVPKGSREIVKNYAESQGKSVSQLVLELLEDQLGASLAEMGTWGAVDGND